MMEQAPRIHKASELASEDIISRMPDDVISNFLDRMPIQYAVRTCILSRNWRFKWTLISQVVFDKKFYKYLRGLGRNDWYDENNISRILLHLKGSITKFEIYIPKNKVLDFNSINHWVMFLSRKGIREFKLTNMNHWVPLTLSSNLFSCVKLERLTLYNCSLTSATTLCGFPYLLHLELDEVVFVNDNLGEIISQCPLLEFLEVSYRNPIGKLKMVNIAKLKNLKCLFIPLCMFDSTTLTSSFVFHLLSHFPKLEEHSLDFYNCEFIRESGGVGNWVRTSLRCLRTLTLHLIEFSSDIMLSFAYEMIWGSPELQNLYISATYDDDDVPPPAFCSSVLKHISMGQLQLQLQSVTFRFLKGSENDICLIKNLLAYSPFLKKIDIDADSDWFFGGENGKLMFAKKLLELHRASSAAKVMIHWY
ncbi:F-box/FBD/LRR-repeat protein At1g13570-like [Rutidosis leptorrhynchoides]|uniref:F-box/FBD/LRR-repeat protein At1g13570-like n=1 Tax=Rutidosis leptorrhynchoides TaxID=125765 RepID=UPI003A99D33A